MFKIHMQPGPYNETIRNPICPEEIKEGVPGIGVIDNDDFAEDTLTGKGRTAIDPYR